MKRIDIHISTCLLLVMPLLLGADWRQFRGGRQNSVAADAKVPQTWNESENVAWTADLPGRGPSSPIVVGDRVFVTASSGVKQDRLHVLCFSARTGNRLWHRQFWATGRTLCHPTSAIAAPTPASDGQFVLAFYSSNDLVCLDLDGNLQWYRGLAYDYPRAGNDVGMSSSPLVVDDTVIVQIESQNDAFAAGIAIKTGQERWHVNRDRKMNWASPTLLENGDGGPSTVLLQSPSGLTAHDPQSGEELWRYEANCEGIPSTVATPGRVYVSSNGLTALEIEPGKPEPTVVWDSNRLSPNSASPVVHEDRVYSVNRGGILTCADVNDGKMQWQLRLGGTFWATPVICGSHIYCINQDGTAKVVRLEPDKGRVVSTNQFGQTILSSPAVAGNALFVRSDRHLWKVASDG